MTLHSDVTVSEDSRSNEHFSINGHSGDARELQQLAQTDTAYVLMYESSANQEAAITQLALGDLPSDLRIEVES